MEHLPLFDGLDGADPTYSVSDLCEEIKGFLGTAFSSVWVVGEVQRVRQSRRGHLYFELVEKGAADDILGKIDCVLWRSDHQRVQRLLSRTDQRIDEGLQMRVRGGVDFYPPAGRLQLIVREVDPLFTMGLLAQRRQETLEALAKAGLMERNKALPLPELPLTLALVTSHGSAAYHDFLHGLQESGYGFRVLFVHASVQGRSAEAELVSALESLAGAPIDCAALIRGGGSKTDLAVFDSRPVAEAVATAPFPVLTGLGHEIDQSITDMVAHTALKTPTKVAELLVERAVRADQRLELAIRDLRREALERLRRGREALGSAERGVELARTRLTAAGARLQEVSRALARTGRMRLAAAGTAAEATARRLAEVAPRLVGRRRSEPRGLADRLVAAARGRLREARATVGGLERLTAELAPQRALERGFSITRNAAGRALRRPDDTAAGERITTRLAGGTVVSRVEET
ncbi:MAG: exodeoxyribonuclease VII large subunit [Acidobacteriota bacterium]|jgi:exodeoxyribonuclease VII large subunit